MSLNAMRNGSDLSKLVFRQAWMRFVEIFKSRHVSSYNKHKGLGITTNAINIYIISG